MTIKKLVAKKQYRDGDPRLTETEVRKRLASYNDTAVTDELYTFGTRMVDKALERFKGLDTKAVAVAAYSIGIITLLVSSKATQEAGLGWMVVFPLGSAIAAFVAAACAVSALWLRQSKWFSQDGWLNAKHLSDVEALRRYQIINMWGVWDSHQSACDGKALRIAAAEGSLLVSAVLLIITLGVIVVA